jgi:hypothetical protein
MHDTLRTGGCLDFQHLPRREFMRVGGLGLLGVSLPALFAADAARARARNCILLFLSGGPSQFETFDPKPDAPGGNGAIFDTTRTSVPGIQLCGLLPDLARQAQRFALIRSAYHRYGGHFGGHRYALSGHAVPGNADVEARADDKPGIISLAAKYLPNQRSNLPASIMTPWPATDQGSGVSGGMGAGTLGRQYDPLLVEVDPRSLDQAGAQPVFRIPDFALRPGLTAERLEDRRRLRHIVESQRRDMLAAEGDNLNSLYQRAYDLLTSSEIKAGFDIDREEPRLRDRYGRNAFGQGCLLARRLIERGARFAQVNFSRSVTQRGYGWDTHDKGHETLKDLLLPKLNAGLATLLDDLAERGLLEETLVVAMGEFGRTPRVKPDGGRDHWPQCYALLLAGGGIRGGTVYGSSDRAGAYPANDPVEARQILVTILDALGVPLFVADVQGRLAPLFPDVEPIRRLW